MDLLYLLIENFKNLLFDLLIIRRSFENLPYLWSCSLSQRWRFWIIRSNELGGIESDLVYTEVLGVAFQYILWPGSLWYPVRNSPLKNKQIFLLVISKTMLTCSTVQLDVAKNHINEYVTKNSSKSLRGATKSSRAQNMLAHSSTLISPFAYFISKTGDFR